MFWTGNYIAVREVNFLLKVENVTLTQVLEADDILQECEDNNKALLQFLTKPKILAELITLITEEPPKNVGLASQYRHANIACEVLTSHLSTLSDQLSMDVVQMNRLCDFINKDPPLNPLLASYFSKTVEMLLERNPKQDWYLHHIVCLRMLDFFKSRRDFLPNLLRHISTSAIADTFKYFIRLDDLFSKIIMEWFEEHQFLECLIQIICGTYVPEPTVERSVAGAEGGAGAAVGVDGEAGEAVGEGSEAGAGVGADAGAHADADARADADAGADAGADVDEDAGGGKDAERERSPECQEKGQHEVSEKASHDHDVADDDSDRGSEDELNRTTETGAEPGEGRGAERWRRTGGVASANAAALLCDIILSGCARDNYNTRPRTACALVTRLQSAAGVQLLLQGVFTAPPHARHSALVHGAHVLQALLDQDPIQGGECDTERTSVELAVAPHLPLLHQALLEAPDGPPGRVGPARVQVAALLAHLALSEVEEVARTMLTLGTPGVVVDMMFAYPNNNFLHAQAYALIKHALENKVYRTLYAKHLLVECDLLTRLMDAFEDNERKSGGPRCAYMGHAVQALRSAGAALEAGALDALALDAGLRARWTRFRDDTLAPLLQRHDTPLGGNYPSDNIYEFIDVTATASLDDVPGDMSADAFNEMPNATLGDYLPDELELEDCDKGESSKNNFLELASQRFDDDMWEDSPEPEGEEDGAGAVSLLEVLQQQSPWDSSEGIAEGLGLSPEAEAAGGWAQFDAFAPAPAPGPGAPAAPAPDPFAPAPGASPAPAPAGTPTTDQFATFWSYGEPNDAEEITTQREIEANVRGLSLDDGLEKLDDAASVELANNLLTAMSGMAPEVVADLVSNMPVPQPDPAPAPAPALAPAPAPAGGAAAPAPPHDQRPEPAVDQSSESPAQR